jgi:hypothetical protein
MRAESDRVTMRSALDDLPLYLFSIWTAPRWSQTLKRRVLFELWDECAEDERDGNSLVVSGATEARGTIVEFIRLNLPEGSRDGFSREELAALNARRGSRRPFAPYDDDLAHFASNIR